MSNVINTVTEKLTTIFTATEEALNAWQGEGNLQFPNLLATLAAKFTWNENDVRQADPLVRFYVRNHPDWYVTRGAHGGIMRTADRQKKTDAKSVKDALKQQMKASIESQTTEE
jgi:hypothetical protein